MKKLYSFDIEREIEEKVPYTRKTKNGPVESTRKVKKKIKKKIIVQRPNASDVENAEFFYGQKFNEYINAGFLTRAMLSKKMGDIGGMHSKHSEEQMQAVLLENLEASRTIEFYAGSKNLTEEQEKKLIDAKAKFAHTTKVVHDYESSIREQFNQTADAKAEQKLIEWFVFNFSFYEEKVGDKTEEFPIFEGEVYKDKRNFYLELVEDLEEDENDANFTKVKEIFDRSFETLIRVFSIWYNKIGTDQESIEKAMKELFSSEQKAEESEEAQDEAKEEPEKESDEG